MRVAVFTGSSKDGAAISLLHAMLALFQNDVLKPQDVTVFYTYALRKKDRTPDSDLFEQLAVKGVRLRPVVVPTDSRPFQYVNKGERGSRVTATMFLKDIIGSIDVYFKCELFGRRYDLIWINQLPYYRLLHLKSRSKVIFARELFFNQDEPARKLIEVIRAKADKVIAIDMKTSETFTRSGLSNVLVISNPVCMDVARSIGQAGDLKLRHKVSLRLEKYTDIIALVGNITPIKGAEFFLDVAGEYASDPSKLFVLVGGGRSTGNIDYYDSIMERVDGMSNVRVYDCDQDEVQVIYGISSLIMRTDSFLPLGRTVYEGLYAGLPVLLPCGEGDDTTEIQDMLGKQIFLYRSRDLNDAVRGVDEVLSKRHSAPMVTESNNYREYAASIKSCLEDCESFQ